MIKTLLTSLVIGIISFNTYAQTKQETVTLLLEKTGTTAEIKQFDAIFEAKIGEKTTSFENEEDFQKFSKIMKSGFNSKNAEIYFKEYLVNNSDKDSLQKTIIMYQNPIFKEMTQIELKANNPDNQQDQMAFFQNMKSNPPSQERIQQLTNLNNELATSKMTVKMLKNIIFSMANGANLGQPKEKQISEEELKTKLQSALPENFSAQMTNQLIALSIYTYKDVNANDLSEYINFWSSPIGKYYINLIFGAYDYSFSKMGEIVGKSFKELEK
jgi:hypothetical protein